MLKEPHSAEEATQDVFLNLWLKASSYNPQRGTPRAWFMSVAHHRIIDLIKSRKRRAQSTDQVDHELLDLHPSPHPSTEEEAHDATWTEKRYSLIPGNPASGAA